MSGFEYGNTRLRVRASEMLTAGDYQTLIASGSVEGMLGALSRGPYAPDVGEVLGRYGGMRGVDEAVLTHLSRQLADVRRFYEDDIRELIDVVTMRWDIRNLRAIFRSLSVQPRPDEPTARLVPAGRLDGAALDEVSRQRDIRSAVDLLSVWRMPSPVVVSNLRQALPMYVQSGNVGVFERALDLSMGELAESVASESGSEDPVVAALQRGVDRINLTAAVRWREARDEGGSAVFMPIRAGRISESAWSKFIGLDDRAVALTHLSGLPASWAGVIESWAVARRTSAELEAGLDDADATDEASRFRLADPLGIEVPLSFIGMKETEAKNVRFVARVIAHDLPRQESLAGLLGVR